MLIEIDSRFFYLMEGRRYEGIVAIYKWDIRYNKFIRIKNGDLISWVLDCYIDDDFKYVHYTHLILSNTQFLNQHRKIEKLYNRYQKMINKPLLERLGFRKNHYFLPSERIKNFLNRSKIKK